MSFGVSRMKPLCVGYDRWLTSCAIIFQLLRLTHPPQILPNPEQLESCLFASSARPTPLLLWLCV